jgi:hypothetical protein
MRCDKMNALSLEYSKVLDSYNCWTICLAESWTMHSSSFDMSSIQELRNDSDNLTSGSGRSKDC